MGLEGMRCPAHKLENIDETGPAKWKSSSVPPPETPTESMEFLARSWSVSATELSRALTTTHAVPKNFDNTTFGFLSHDTGIGNPMMSKDHGMEPMASVDSPPVSPRGSEETKELFLLHQALHPELLTNQQLLKNGLYKSILKGKTMGRRVKDQRERKKQEMRTHNAQLHASVSVAGVAAAVAALTASSATLAEMSTGQHKGHSKTSAAIASAAALVASHCIEIAEELGADRDQILTAVNSAINARTNGDVMTLTAAAATALRGASTLKARLQKGYGGTTLALGEPADDGKDINCMSAMNFVMRGGELLKRTRKGDLHWKQVSFSINSTFQVVVKLKSRHIVGAFTKKKKSIVTAVHTNIPAWPGREHEDDAGQRDYFGIQTAERVIEFECKSKTEKQMWTDGIHHLLHCRISMPFP